MKKWIERALNIQSGDLGRGTLLCACLFLVITSYVIGKVAGAALFLSRFQAKQLAYADISSSVIVALAVAGVIFDGLSQTDVWFQAFGAASVAGKLAGEVVQYFRHGPLAPDRRVAPRQ